MVFHTDPQAVSHAHSLWLNLDDGDRSVLSKPGSVRTVRYRARVYHLTTESIANRHNQAKLGNKWT